MLLKLGLLGAVLGVVQPACSGLPSTSNAATYKITISSSTKTWTIKCTESTWVFVNNVRSVDGVNTTELDEDNQISGSCSTGSNVPNIFSYLGADREWYCQPGCNPIFGEQWKVSYPEEVFSREGWSPPIRPVSKTVTVECAEGYGRAIGDEGATQTSCSSTAGWTVNTTQLISCKNGCKDITSSIEYAETTATATTTYNRPPFVTGDIVPFNCKTGYVLVGYQTLTCNSVGEWHAKMPQCVAVAGNSAIVPYQGPATARLIFLLSLAVLVR